MNSEESKVVKEVIDDFKNRANMRKNFDLIWQINMNFLMGNQFCNVPIPWMPPHHRASLQCS